MLLNQATTAKEEEGLKKREKKWKTKLVGTKLLKKERGLNINTQTLTMRGKSLPKRDQRCRRALDYSDSRPISQETS